MNGGAKLPPTSANTSRRTPHRRTIPKDPHELFCIDSRSPKSGR